MATIQFNTIVNKEQVIRPPADVVLPQGAIEVTVRSLPQSEKSDVDSLAETRHWLLTLAAEAEKMDPDLPSDMAEHHDHYAHGKPLP